MNSLNELEPLLPDSILSSEVKMDQIDIFFNAFTTDFINSTFMLNGKKIKIFNQKPNQKEFNKYTETFYHIITRKTNIYNHRLYDCNRANRIHWIKPILQSHPCEEIKYYKWKDKDGICKEHFWLYSKNFMVVLKNISSDLQIVTAFCVDKDEQITFYERFIDFRDNLTNC
jgi:hypothetical protein